MLDECSEPRRLGDCFVSASAIASEIWAPHAVMGALVNFEGGARGDSARVRWDEMRCRGRGMAWGGRAGFWKAG